MFPDPIEQILTCWQRVLNLKVFCIVPGVDVDQDLHLPVADLLQHGSRHVAATGKDLHHCGDVNDRRPKLVLLAVVEQMASKGPKFSLGLDCVPRVEQCLRRWWAAIKVHGEVRCGRWMIGRVTDRPREPHEAVHSIGMGLRHGSRLKAS